MMKSRFRYVLLIALMVLLCGCQTDNLPLPTQEPTESVTESATQQPDIRSADSLYTNMQVAIGMKNARSYVLVEECAVASEDASYEVVSTSSICWHDSPFQAYTKQEVKMDLNAPGMDMSMTDVSEVYVQVEDRVPVDYIYYETYDVWYRYEEDCLPSEVKNQYVCGVLPGTRPTRMTMDPVTVDFEGREAYVLRFAMSYEDWTLTAADGVDVEVVYHVDAETFLPLQLEITYSGMEEYLMETIEEAMGLDLGEASMFQRLEMRVTVSDISFEEMQVPTVPEEGIANSQSVNEEGDIAQTL